METEARPDSGLVTLVATLVAQGADGRAGLRTLLQEIESRYPGEVQRMAAALTLQKLSYMRGRA
jgi:hypothetical protein